MRRPSRRGPLVALTTLAALTVAGCDADSGTTPAPTATTAPAPTATSGAPMDDSDRTSGTDDSDRTSGGDDAAGATLREVGAGALLTDEDSGTVVRLSPGESALLRLTPPLQDSTPGAADPDVVELVPVQHFADPGYAEYELLARSPGRTRVSVRGPGADAVALVVLVVVQGR